MEFSDSDCIDLVSDYDCPSIVSQQVTESPDRKRSFDEPLDMTQLWLAVRLRTKDVSTYFDEPKVWLKTTHVFIEDGIGFNEMVPTVSRESAAIIPLCHEFKKQYPHIKIVWCMENQMNRSDELDRALGTRPFWDQLDNLRVACCADMIELNLEGVPMRQGAVPSEGWKDYLILVFPNNVHTLKFCWGSGLVKHLVESVSKIVVNSFGMMDKESVFTPHGRMDMIKCKPECGLVPFNTLVGECLSEFRHKIVVGIDTQAVRYLLDSSKSEYFCRFELLSRKDLFMEKETGYRPPGDSEKRQYKYQSVYYPDVQGTLLELRRKKVLVSYDSVNDISSKCLYIKDYNLGGCVIGNLELDLGPEHRNSLLALIRKKVFEQ